MLASLLLFIVLFSSGSEHSGYVIAALGMGIWWVNFPPPHEDGSNGHCSYWPFSPASPIIYSRPNSTVAFS